MNVTQWESRKNAFVNLITQGVSSHLIAVVLNEILALKSEELVLLQTIQSDVQDIKRGPFNEGQEFLREASRPHRDTAKQRIDIENARRAFIAALGRERRDKFRQSIIKYRIAECYALQGDGQSSKENLVESYDSAGDAIKVLWANIEKEGKKDIPLLIGTLGIASVFQDGAVDKRQEAFHSKQGKISRFIYFVKGVSTAVGLADDRFEDLTKYTHQSHIKNIEISNFLHGIFR